MSSSLLALTGPDLSAGVFSESIGRDVAVSIRGLSKSYTLDRTARHTTAGEALMHTIRNPFARAERETFWALRDVSFDVRQGDVVGIIGRNGAGKSTLLKILSRITTPTAGRVDLYGRVGSLLEVGTGFSAELTGRENVYLNGAILGMRRAEITRQFDAIVEFAEVEQFLDTPVKRYSSGMYVRLAFAVAAHLSPDILIVDEVLAVGDVRFQKKCLGKMHEVAEQQGRTVLFVSHNMAAMENLCGRALLLDGGRLLREGPTAPIIRHYLETVLPGAVTHTPLSERRDRAGDGRIRFTDFYAEDDGGIRLGAVSSGLDVTFVLEYENTSGGRLNGIDVGLSFSTSQNQLLSVLFSSYAGRLFTADGRAGAFRCRVPRLPLSPGRYGVAARAIVGGEDADWPNDGVGTLEVEGGDFYGTGSAGFGPSVPLMLDGDWAIQGSHP